MKCCVCEKSIVENQLSAVPIEPKGMKSVTGEDRKWICTNCLHHLPRVIQEVFKKLSHCTMKENSVIEEQSKEDRDNTIVFVAEELKEE